MVSLPINQLELSEELWRIFNQIIQEGEQALEKLPLNEGLQNRDNLIAYLALRKHIYSDLNQQLVDRGLATLEQSYNHVLYTLKRILKNLDITTFPPTNLIIPTPFESRAISKKRNEELLGKRDSQLQSIIMVTLDAKMVSQHELMEELLLNGMNIARINCAHDNEEVWKRLIESLKGAENRLKDKGQYIERSCKIYMDLAGPKVRIGKLQPGKIAVVKGDLLRLYLDSNRLGHPATEASPASVPVTLERAFRNVRIKDRIFIDDGKIHGIVRKVTKEYVELEILSPMVGELRIKEGKGLNMPDSFLSLNVPSITEKDIGDLPFITKHADILGVSFVHSPLDLKKIKDELEKYSSVNIAVVAKIETKDAIHHLARIIMEGLTFKEFGIMIARGDLAVEVGPENLFFVQEEILNICSAAYIPVIWATGVLEKLTKKGIPSRAEITDASYGKRADCIMLNKGPYIIESLKMLEKLLKIEVDPPRKQSSVGNLTSQYGVFLK